METHDDQPSQENIQEQGTSVDQQEEETVTSPVRSYDCIFCKRGFSNAQALGGHMNIHRKDKAKLKKAPAAVSSNINNYENQQSLNISKIRALYDPVLPVRPSMEVMGSNTTAAAAKQRPNWTLGEENDAAKTDKTQLGEVWKLPLFVERSPPLKTDQRAASSSPDEKDLASSSSEEEEDLDLELRLGPEPQQDSSTSATGTKKFF